MFGSITSTDDFVWKQFFQRFEKQQLENKFGLVETHNSGHIIATIRRREREFPPNGGEFSKKSVPPKFKCF